MASPSAVSATSPIEGNQFWFGHCVMKASRVGAGLTFGSVHLGTTSWVYSTQLDVLSWLSRPSLRHVDASITDPW